MEKVIIGVDSHKLSAMIEVVDDRDQRRTGAGSQPAWAGQTDARPGPTPRHRREDPRRIAAEELTGLIADALSGETTVSVRHPGWRPRSGEPVLHRALRHLAAQLFLEQRAVEQFPHIRDPGPVEPEEEHVLDL